MDDFNAVERLEKFYGKIPENEKMWIEDNIESLTDEQKGKYFKALTTIHEFKNGYPEISVMGDVYKKVMNKAPKSYAWSVCLECKCEYDYRLACCPACYAKEMMCTAKAVKKSNIKPSIIQYNKTYLNGDKNEPICYKCEKREGSYCKHFGQTDWNCRREEFESCECRTCCAITKKANKALEGNKEIKSGYAIPLKRG